MKKLTIITILLAIPTMIAGFWGMNMPVPFQAFNGETSSVWFFVVIAVALLVTAGIGVVLLRPTDRARPKKGKKQNRNRKKK